MQPRVKSAYEFGSFRLDPEQNVLFRGDEIVHVTPKVFDTLRLLVCNHGQVVDKETFLAEIWPDVVVEEANLTKNISVLRKVLSEGGVPSNSIETVPKRGYRLVVPVREVRTDIQAGSERSANPAPKHFVGREWTRLGLLIGTALFLLGASVGIGFLGFDSRIPAEDIRSIAILPFSTDPSAPDFAQAFDGAYEGLISRVSQFPELRVRAQASVAKYRGLAAPPRQIFDELGVDAILAGRIVQDGEMFTATFELIRNKDESVLWSKQYKRLTSDAVRLDRELAEELAGAIRPTMPAIQVAGITRPYTANAEAYKAYLKGRMFGRRRTFAELTKAEEFYKRAIEIDPNYALAWSGLADLYAWQTQSSEILRDNAKYRAMMADAASAVEKAVTLEPELAEVRTSRAMTRLALWDWQGAEEDFQAAIRSNPNYIFARHQYALLLATLGRFDETFDQLDMASKLEPVETRGGLYPHLLYRAGRYEEALAYCNRALELAPDDDATVFTKSLIFTELGRHEEALEAAKQALALVSEGYNPVYETQIARASLSTGKTKEAERILAKLISEVPGGHASPFRVAVVFAAKEDSNAAFKWLEKAYDDRERLMISVKTNPAFRSLHSDPRWNDLLRRVGFPD